MIGERRTLDGRLVEVVSETPIESETFHTDKEGKRYTRPLRYIAVGVRAVRDEQEVNE